MLFYDFARYLIVSREFHGGARKNAGRKQKFSMPLKFQIRVTKEEKDFINYAREHHLNYSSLMKI